MARRLSAVGALVVMAGVGAAGSGWAQTTAATPQEAEAALRALFDATAALYGPESTVTYDGAWSAQPGPDGVTLSVPATVWTFGAATGLSIGPQQIVYTATADDGYRLTWPAQDMDISQTMGGAGIAFDITISELTSELDMAAGAVFPQRSITNGAGMTIRYSAFGMPVDITAGAIESALTTTQRADGRFDASIDWSIDTYTVVDQFSEMTMDRTVNTLTVIGLDPHAAGTALDEYMGLIELVATDMGSMTFAQDVSGRLTGLLTQVPVMAESLRTTSEATGFTMDAWPLSMVMDEVIVHASLTGLSRPVAQAGGTIEMHGISVGDPSVDALLPGTIAIDGKVQNLPVPNLVALAERYIRAEDGSGPDVPHDALPQLLSRAGTQFALTRFLVEYPDTAIDVSGRLSVNTDAMWDVVGGVDAWLINAPALAALFQSNPNVGGEIGMLTEIVLPLGQPATDAPQDLLFNIHVNESGAITLNGFDFQEILSRL